MSPVYRDMWLRRCRNQWQQQAFSWLWKNKLTFTQIKFESESLSATEDCKKQAEEKN